jgi:hypothetical protein
MLATGEHHKKARDHLAGLLQSCGLGLVAQRATPVVTGAAVAVFTFRRGVSTLTWCGKTAEGATCACSTFVAPSREACTGEIGSPFAS